MSLFSPSDIQAFRDLRQELGYPDSFRLEEDTEVPDGSGGTTTTTRTVAAGSCRLDTTGLQPAEAMIAERLGWSVAYTVDLPYGTPITPAHRLIVNGRVFDVGGVLTGGQWATGTTAVIREAG